MERTDAWGLFVRRARCRGGRVAVQERFYTESHREPPRTTERLLPAGRRAMRLPVSTLGPMARQGPYGRSAASAASISLTRCSAIGSQ